MRSPRHCMVVHARYPLTETRVQREAETLVAGGYTVDVICLRDDGEPPRERHRGVQIHRLPVKLDKRSLGRQLFGYLHFLLLATIRLTKLHLRHPYHTVQVHNLPDFLVFCAVVPKLQRVPIILDLHDLMPEFFAGRFGARRPLVSWLIRKQERLACRFADHVITVSEHWRRSLVQRGVAEDKCSVIMNVADERLFVTRNAESTNGASFHLVYHGTVTYRYGLDLAIQAVGLVRDEIPDIRLTILGMGDHLPTLVRLRRELDLEDVVELLAEWYLPEDGLVEFIAGASLGIVPYRNDVFTDELLPTKLMEYAVMGIPCVAARTTAIEAYFRETMVEFFTPGDAIDMARCIRELHRSPSRRAELARASRNFVRRYNWERIGADYLALVKSLPASTSVVTSRSPRTRRSIDPARQAERGR